MKSILLSSCGSSSDLFKASSTIQKRNLTVPLHHLISAFFSSNTYYPWTFLTDKIQAYISLHVINTTSQISSRHLKLPCKCPSLIAFFLRDHSTLITPVTKLKTSTTFILMLCFAPYLQLAGVPLGPQFLSQQPFPFHVSLL